MNEDVRKSINSSKEFEKLFETLMIQDSNKLGNENDKLIYLNKRQVIEQIEWNLNVEPRKQNIKVLPLNQPMVSHKL